MSSGFGQVQRGRGKLIETLREKKTISKYQMRTVVEYFYFLFKYIFQVPYFPDYKSLRSISRISQKMRHDAEKNIYKSHWTISRIRAELEPRAHASTRSCPLHRITEQKKESLK